MESDDRLDPSDQAARLREAVLSAQEKAAEPSRDTDHRNGTNRAIEVEPDEPSDELSLSEDPDDSFAGGPALTRKSKSPRNKHELIEELHRNYQEVLGLVRKLDGHLDEARGRSEKITDVAEQYSKLGPVLESLPDRLADNAARLSSDLRTSIGEEGAAAREILERIESAIVHVGTDIERSTDQQGRLVQTMAEFRESLSDLSKSSTAACEAVRDSESRAADRDDAMLAQIRQTRFWLIGLTVGVGAIGLTAIILGFMALKG